ncbi:EAL domain-containing protein [Sphingomonas changnyeongensis]|uniref:EAL domain-containing protein n=1 Tax=Sphingomonas changnyeongensis TaxID=2698679 RepID=A0A7Z2NTW4_9SPHN|nr:bifunctional diguanylate cyclase/phosphodiesterase [Sphingomonas changnyeongensis]QHL89778.1 EAL domain-containing protein [Sphingomonas changnyeongensis]
MTAQPIPGSFAPARDPDMVIRRLEARLARERQARLAAEAIAEKGLRDLYVSRNRLELLYRIVHIANETDDPLTAIGDAVREICLGAGWAFGHALALAGARPEDGLRSTGRWFAQMPDQLFPFLHASQHRVFGPETSLVGRLLGDRRPCWTGDLSGDSGFTRAAAARRCGLAGAVVAPVLVGSELVAGMEFFLADSQPPDPEWLELLAQAGVQIGRVFQREQHARQLIDNATRDPLTRLPNRGYFEQRLHAAFAAAHASGPGRVAVLFIDLDGFKLVNDTLGHPAGDALIKAVAARLGDVTSRLAAEPGIGDLLLARLGGDEFVLMVAGDGIAVRAEAMAAAVHEALAPRHLIAGTEVRTMGSIGIAIDDGRSTDPADLIRDADIAMFAAKSKGAGRTALFTAAMHAEAVRRFEIETDLRAAIEDEAFELHYQPIVTLADRAVVAFEALLRWRRADGRLEMPDAFIPAAEKNGLIVAIGTWVLREACRTAARWRAQLGGRHFHLSVNIAPQQFQQPNFTDQLCAILLETGADPRNICLELTESAAMVNPAHAAATVARLRQLGLRVSVDDFGTGYSALAHLQHMPVDTLKIDRSFITAQQAGNADWAIVGAMTQLAEALQLNVVVEGIESDYQLGELERMGCGYGQGWLFGRPMAEADAYRMIAASADGTRAEGAGPADGADQS